MAYTQYLADIKQMKLDVPIDGQDVAGGLLEHIRSLKMLQEKLERRWKGQLSSDEERCSDSENGSENSEEKDDDPDYEPAEIKRSKTEDQRIIPSQKRASSKEHEQPVKSKVGRGKDEARRKWRSGKTPRLVKQPVTQIGIT